MNSWMAPALRINTAHTTDKMISMRVLTGSSYDTYPKAPDRPTTVDGSTGGGEDA